MSKREFTEEDGLLEVLLAPPARPVETASELDILRLRRNCDQALVERLRYRLRQNEQRVASSEDEMASVSPHAG